MLFKLAHTVLVRVFIMTDAAAEVRRWGMSHGAAIHRTRTAEMVGVENDQPGGDVVGKRPFGDSWEFEAVMLCWSLGALPS